MLEPIRDEIGIQMPIDDRKNVPVKGGGDTGRIIVVSLQEAHVLDEIRPKQEPILRSQQATHISQKRGGFIGGQVPDGPPQKDNQARSPFREGRDRVFEVTDHPVDPQSRIIITERMGGLSEYIFADVDRHIEI